MKYFLKIFISIFIPLFIIELIFKFLSFEGIGFELIRVVLYTIQTSLLFSIILSVFKPIVSKIFIPIMVFISGLYALIQLAFKGFMGNYMSLGMLKAGDATRVSDEFWTFICSIKPIFYTCLIPFVVLVIVFIIKKINYQKLNLKNYIVLISTLIIVSIGCFFSLNISDATQLKSNKELYKNPSLIDVSLKQFGYNRFLYRDIIGFIFENNTDLIQIEKTEPVYVPTDYSRTIDDTAWLQMIENEKNTVINNLHQYYINQSITPKNEYTGIFEDKNLILIMVEAFDLAAIDPEITPNLYKLTQEGWYFDNYYAPKYSCTTGESEFIAEMSIIPSLTYCTPHKYVNNNYSTSIFNLFNNKGYTSTSYHGWDDKYYPRTELHANMGSSFFYNSDDFGFSTSRGWTSDLELMKKSYDVFKEQDKYFSFLITVSMHFSYDFDDDTTRKNLPLLKDVNASIEMKRYLAKAMELDYAIGYLLDSLEQDGTLDDTVIVLFGDHHPYNLKFSYLDDFSDVDRTEGLNEDLMPFIIYNSEQEPQVISKTSSTFDILPTLANLFNLEYDPRYYMGKDIFSNEETIAIFPNGNWVTDNAIYYASKNKYELKNENLDEEYIKKVNKIVKDKFSASNNTLVKDYFNYRFPN